MSERSYRRGVHQAFYAAYCTALASMSLEDVRLRLGALADEAKSLRECDQGAGCFDLIDEISYRVQSRFQGTN